MPSEKEKLRKEVKRSMSRLVAESLNDIELILSVIASIVDSDSDVVDEGTRKRLKSLDDVHSKVRTKIMYVNSSEMRRLDAYIDGIDVKGTDWNIIKFDN